MNHLSQIPPVLRRKSKSDETIIKEYRNRTNQMILDKENADKKYRDCAKQRWLFALTTGIILGIVSSCAFLFGISP